MGCSNSATQVIAEKTIDLGQLYKFEEIQVTKFLEDLKNLSFKESTLRLIPEICAEMHQIAMKGQMLLLCAQHL
jgi:hypothetical protein